MRSEFASAPWPSCPAPFNLAAHVLARAGARADRSALQVVRPTGAERWSYARLEAAVRGTGTGFGRMGLAPGARILMRLGNTPDFPVVYLAALAAGFVPVPTSPLLTGPEIMRMAAVVAPDLIVAGPDIALPDPLTCPVLPSDRLADMAALPPCDYDMGSPDRLAYVVFTSGTSGRPQAVAHAHRAIWARGMMHQGWYGLTEDDRLLHAGAFNWTFTLGTGLLDPWTVGATALIPAPGVTPAQIPHLARRFDATILAGAPGVFRQMLREGMPPLPRLRHALVAGERLPEALRDDWVAATGTPMHESLGMSECSTFISGSPARPAPRGATGHPQPGRHVAILGPDGAPVPIGETGELAIARSDPGLFLEYIGDPAATAARFRGDWFLTGDMARADAGGAITYLGRDDDMMNAGGFRVSPTEVEAAFADCPGVAECAAVEVEVRADVRVIGLFYTGPQPLDEAALVAHAQARLARYKAPRLYRHLDALPRGANNKLNRRALRALGAGDSA
ncbi:long-chain fatty acid--CoA ligase [Aliigemmobacter aestuarii]|uniref:Long-chain fatty acid--CoA ligase n=1 Tax=Aliigemmobacter aestuarii TaxID=1445661 RepID=A0A4S3MMN4_9RHOB|nr:class I adenylate-forming enzyme family protein [Gemmobacter aestuarii]THD83082.1 long-chain fatty acid--CoA ligase [Gemmobacter aestuarii]